MSLHPVVKANHKVKFLLGSLFVVLLLGGCVKQKGSTVQACRQMEAAVQVAQTQYDDAVEDLSRKKDKNTTKNTALKIQSLAELQEKAFDVCSTPYSTASAETSSFLGGGEQ